MRQIGRNGLIEADFRDANIASGSTTRAPMGSWSTFRRRSEQLETAICDLTEAASDRTDGADGERMRPPLRMSCVQLPLPKLRF
jgi:hypothetical protein